MSSIRVLHCPTMTGGNPQGLARVERELGLQSWAVALQPTRYNYPADEILVSSPAAVLRAELSRWPLLWRAYRHYDIIHFNYGRSIFPPLSGGLAIGSEQYSPLIRRLYNAYAAVLGMRDIRLLRRLKKGIVVTYQGDDARQGDYSRWHAQICIAKEVESGYYTAKSDAAKRKAIEIFDRHAHRIFYLNPDLSHVLPRRASFMPYAHIDLRSWIEKGPARTAGDRPVVVHAPTHQGVKGTKYVLEAVRELKTRKVPFEFVLLEGMSHEETRRVCEDADLLIDQVLAGWYGGLAVEVMALGKPVICYIRKDDLKAIPPAMSRDLPIIDATPGTLAAVLEEWLTSRKNELASRGRLSRIYVEKWHNPLDIAAKLKKEYEAILAEI